MLHIKLFQNEVCPKRQSGGSGSSMTVSHGGRHLPSASFSCGHTSAFNSDCAEVQVQARTQPSLHQGNPRQSGSSTFGSSSLFSMPKNLIPLQFNNKKTTLLHLQVLLPYPSHPLLPKGNTALKRNFNYLPETWLRNLLFKISLKAGRIV